MSSPSRGNTPDMLAGIDAVANDLRFDARRRLAVVSRRRNDGQRELGTSSMTSAAGNEPDDGAAHRNAEQARRVRTLANAIGDAGGAIAAVDMRSVGKTRVVRDVTIGRPSDLVGNEVRRAVEAIDGARIIFASDSTFLAHIGGKIRIDPKITIKSRQDSRRLHAGRRARLDGDRGRSQ